MAFYPQQNPMIYASAILPYGFPFGYQNPFMGFNQAQQGFPGLPGQFNQNLGYPYLGPYQNLAPQLNIGLPPIGSPFAHDPLALASPYQNPSLFGRPLY